MQEHGHPNATPYGQRDDQAALGVPSEQVRALVDEAQERGYAEGLAEGQKAVALAAELLASITGDYRRFVLAARGCPDGDDYWRWNGHAEARRQVGTALAARFDLPPVDWDGLRR